MRKPWGAVDPNSTHQRWSRWVATVRAHRTRRPTLEDVRLNWTRYVRRLFRTTVGRIRVEVLDDRYRLVAELEGPPVHDPAYVAWVRRELAGAFVAKGFGPGAVLEDLETALLAGSAEDGRPAAQLLVLPRLTIGKA
jgi:hypothetical protein